MLEPNVLVHVLSDRHVPGLTIRRLQVLGGNELGCSVEDTASGLGLSPATVRRHLSLLLHLVFDPTEVEQTNAHLAEWCRLHGDCCTSAVKAMVANHQLFDRCDQHHAPSQR